MNAANKKKPAEEKLGIFRRIALYIRQIFGELKKVQRPSRSELWQMFLTVILFVAVIMVLVGLLDAAFGRLALWIFG